MAGKGGPADAWNRLGRLAAAASAAFVAACATPGVVPQASEEARRQEADTQRALIASGRVQQGTPSPYLNFPVEQRLDNIARRIKMANADSCNGNTKTDYKITIGNPNMGAPVVMDSDGLRPFDQVTGVNGVRVSPDVQGTGTFLSVRDSAAASGRPLVVTAMRNMQPVSATFAPVKMCNYKVNIIQNMNVFNAFTLGEATSFGGQVLKPGVYVAWKVLNTLSEDDMVAAVMGHEITHLLEGHTQSKKTNAIIGGILGTAADLAVSIGTGGKINTGGALGQFGMGSGATAYSQGFERAADSGGVKMMAKANYDPWAAVRLMRLMAGENPDAMERGKSHPPTPDRGADTAQQAQTTIRSGKPFGFQ